MNTNCFAFYAKNITTSTLPSSKFPRFFNFWSSERHQSLLGNGRVVTKINAVNFNLIISKNTANLHISRSFSQKLNGKLNVLVNVFIFFNQRKQFFELTKPWLLQGISIHKFSVCLQPVEHIMLFYSMLTRVPMIGFYECNHFLISGLPLLILRHNSYHLHVYNIMLSQPSFNLNPII